MFVYANSSILGGLCIASQNITNNNNEKSVILSCDICSLYPYIMNHKLPISHYRFVDKFNKNRYGQDKNHSCLLNDEIYTTEKVLDNKTLSQFPGLVSKSEISYDQLSEFQRKNLKSNHKSSQKLISHLGHNKNSYFSFEMYEMMKSLGYRISIKKILEYKQTNFMKSYIDFLFDRKSYYKSIGDICMSNTFKILANSLFGVTMTRRERFKNFKIVTTEKQVDIQVK